MTDKGQFGTEDFEISVGSAEDADADGKMILKDPVHPPTMHELMTHTAGFTYGIFGNTPVDKMYQDARLLRCKSLQEFIDKPARFHSSISRALFPAWRRVAAV